MKRKIRRCVSVLAAAAVLISGIQAPASVQAQVKEQQTGGSRDVRLSGDNGTTVTTSEDFMNALQQGKSLIIVANQITIGEAVESDKRMSPIMIPKNTVIQGSTPTSAICSRSPIQLEGDGVRFENIELTFESSDALGSVPHREIFLAGHSLILDHVNTYLEGGAGLGGFGGTEEELLPTVYAGGFSNTAIGGQASLTVTNSSDKTIFQAIYMGHNEENDNKVPYRGNAVLNLDAKATVRDVVDTSLSSWAEINMNGSENQYANAKKIYGNTNTVLTLNGVSIENAVAEGVGSIVLKNKAFMSTVTEQLQNVTLISGSCLDFNSVTDVQIAGNFAGEANQAERGILVLNPQGTLTIGGDVTGTTQFQTKSRWFPGLLLTDKVYILTGADKGSLQDFVLAQKKIDEGYELIYEAGQWKVCGEPVDSREIGRINILSAPSKVDLRKIVEKEEGVIPDENVFFEIKWYDENDNVFSDEDVIEYMFYEMDQVIRVRTDYWESDSEDILDETDWSQDVTLMASEEHPGKYYLQASDGAKPGEYTFLFCSEYIEHDLHTMAEVKALKDIVKAEEKVFFYDQDLQEPEEPGHKHEYQSAVTKEATCTEAGIRTYTCSCGDQYTEEIDAAGHQEVKDPAVEPTETTEGKTEGSHCGVCGEVLKAQESIPALGKPEEPGHRHTYQSAVTKEATCTEAGIRTYTCSCGDQYTEGIDAAGHQEVKDPAVEPTETTEGKTEGSHCGVCGEVLKAQESIPALGKPEEPGHRHTYQSAVTKEATCTEAGIRTYTCSCGDQYTEEIDAAGHQEVKDPAVEPTETTEGKTEGSHCGVCGEVLKAQESIPALGKPEEPGHRHTYQSAVTKEATCTEAGIRTYTCSCGDQYTEEIDAAGHREVKDPAVEPTETTEGKTEGSHCGVCGEVLKAQESIPALGKPEEPGHKHTYESTVKKKPTCIEPGVKIFICSCGEKYTEEISALNHRYMEKCIPATMKADGKLQQICSICSDIKSETVIESPRKITWSQTDFTYDGKTKAPTVIIKDRKDRRLISGRDYQINYPAGRKKPGIYTVVLKFCGNYSGSVMETFMIRPQAAFLKKIAAKSRGIQVKWKKQETPIDGYQIQYSTNKDFKGRTAKITAVPKNASAKKILNLKAKKKYYVRIRTYKDVKVNGKNRTLYSDWSGRKTAVAKK